LRATVTQALHSIIEALVQVYADIYSTIPVPQIYWIYSLRFANFHCTRRSSLPLLYHYIFIHIYIYTHTHAQIIDRHTSKPLSEFIPRNGQKPPRISGQGMPQICKLPLHSKVFTSSFISLYIHTYIHIYIYTHRSKIETPQNHYLSLYQETDKNLLESNSVPGMP